MLQMSKPTLCAPLPPSLRPVAAAASGKEVQCCNWLLVRSRAAAILRGGEVTPDETRRHLTPHTCKGEEYNEEEVVVEALFTNDLTCVGRGKKTDSKVFFPLVF